MDEISKKDEITDTKAGIDSIISRFMEVNQAVFSELEKQGRTIESVEITIAPIEHNLYVQITEHRDGDLKKHQKSKQLEVKQVDFYEHIKKHLPASNILRHVDTTNITPEIMEKVMERERQRRQPRKEDIKAN